MIVTIECPGPGNAGLAARARQAAEQHPARTPERRAAAAGWVVLSGTKSLDSARRALRTFGSARTQADAAGLLDRLSSQDCAVALDPQAPRLRLRPVRRHLPARTERSSMTQPITITVHGRPCASGLEARLRGPRQEPKPRKPRKGRARCWARRKDGQPCGAPAIPGGTVCRRHGGSAPQVRLAAERVRLTGEMFRAYEAWREIRATEHVLPGRLAGPREEHALDRLNQAEHALEQFESDLDLIALMKMEITDPTSPETRQLLLQAARDRLEGRPWKSPVRR